MQTRLPMENNPLLIEAFRQGKDEALREIFKNYSTPLCFFANKLIGNQEDSEEVVNDIFIRLFKLRENFKTLTNIKAFLYISTRNACLDRINSNSRRRINSLNEEVYNVPEATDNQPEWAPFEVELLNQIWQSVQYLPPQCRKIFTMHYIQHMTVTEIANALELTPPTVVKQLRIGEAKMKELITWITFLLLLTSLIGILIK